MANENLENLVKIRQLKAEPATEEEIAGLLRSGLARLEDSKNKDLNMESRFDLAYNAACLIKPTENETLPSMRAISTSMMNYSRHSYESPI
jgi:hypothetical protein